MALLHHQATSTANSPPLLLLLLAEAGLPKALCTRIVAVIACAAGRGVPSQALELYNSWLSAIGCTPSTAPDKFLLRNFHKFLRTGSIKDKPRSGRPHKLPDAVAKEASALIKMGYMVASETSSTQTKPLTCRKYYTSIRQACEKIARLRDILSNYDMTPSQLLARMHAVDPDLRFMKLHYKRELSSEEKAARKKFALAQLKKIRDNPKHLHRVFYMDEASVLFVTGMDPNIKVWADVHDKEVQQVLHIPHLPKCKPFKVHFVVVVNPLLGPVFMEMTSGTTDIVREHNKKEGAYMVSLGLGFFLHRRIKMHPAAPALLLSHSSCCCCSPASSSSRYHTLLPLSPHPAVA